MHGLPNPAVDVRVGPYEVDFLWRDRKAIVETDGYATHGGRSAFNSDETRDARLRTMGYTVQRFAYQHVMHEDAFMAGTVHACSVGAARRPRMDGCPPRRPSRRRSPLGPTVTASCF